MTLKKMIYTLINSVEVLKLTKEDIDNSKEYLENREYGLAFDTVITQLYEYEVEIGVEFYELVSEIGRKMKIDEKEYSYLKELIIIKK